MRNEPAVQADRLEITLGENRVFSSLSMSAAAGSITAVLGRNGSGKTTLVRALATLQRYDSGSLRVFGTEVSDHQKEIRNAIGLAGQHAAVVPELTGLENLTMVARFYGLSRREAREAAVAVIDQFALADFVARRVATYSGGQRRRLDLAVTFVRRPALLLLDEPTTGLDPISRKDLWEMIRTLPRDGTTVVLTTQYLDEAQALADDVVVIGDGRSLRTGSPQHLRNTTASTTLHLATEDRFPHSVADTLAQQLGGTVTDSREQSVTLTGQFDLNDTYRAVDRLELTSALTEFSVSPPSLDDVFASLTTHEDR